MELTLPHSKEAEEAILGVLITERNAFDEVSSILAPESFYELSHRLVYAIIADLHRNNKPVDFLTVSQTAMKLHPDKIDIYEISGFLGKVSSVPNLKAHAAIIADLAGKRNLITTAHTIIKNSQKSDLDELLAIWRTQLEQIEESAVNDTPTSLKEYLPTAANLLNTPETSKGITTGFPSLDNRLGGLKPGRMYILGGRPGQGKTSVALHTAIENAKAGKNTLFFSAEQDINDLANKIIGSTSGLGHQYLDNSKLTENDWQKLDETFMDIASFPGNIWLKDNIKSIQHIAAIIRQQKKRTGLDLVVVDYLQLIPSMNKGNIKIREQEVAEISRTLKQLSLSEKIPVMALSQLNRDAKGEPKLHHLRESGSIEQDADAVLFVYRPSMDDPDSIKDDNDYIIVEKNRRGSTGKIKFYNQDMARFSDQPFDRPF